MDDGGKMKKVISLLAGLVAGFSLCLAMAYFLPDEGKRVGPRFDRE